MKSASGWYCSSTKNVDADSTIVRNLIVVIFLVLFKVEIVLTTKVAGVNVFTVANTNVCGEDPGKYDNCDHNSESCWNSNASIPAVSSSWRSIMSVSVSVRSLSKRKFTKSRFSWVITGVASFGMNIV